MATHAVVVVGAGLAGLSAARRLVADGRDPVVLEARDRVGGRTEHGSRRRPHRGRARRPVVGPTQDLPAGSVIKLHWAGAETATRWNGYMDGAVGSGLRAADEVAAALD